MIRLTGRAIALIALIALPSAALAQKEPPDTKETKEANKFMGLALMRQTAEQKKPFFQQALGPLQQAMVKNPDNAKVWLLVGQVYAGLGDYIGADSAFRKAEALYPAYAEEISGEREVAWVEAFNAGLQAMDAKNNDEAIKQLELAELMYAHRPEAKMNLGALYAGKNDVAKAIKAFEGAIAATNGPLKEKLKPEDQASWKRYADMAKMNIAQLIGAQGVELFTAEKFDEAAQTFMKAMQINPHSRDYLYNLAQSYYAKASKIEEQRNALLEEETKLKKTKGQEAAAKAKADEAAKLATELLPLYEKIAEVSLRTMVLDPQNESLYHLAARSYKLTGDIATDPKVKSEWQNKALEVLKKREDLQFEVTEVQVGTGEGEATIRGTIKNLKAAAGSPIKIRVTLIGPAGTPIGSNEFSVAAPAAEQTTTFEGKIPVTGEIAGWKYEVVK